MEAASVALPTPPKPISQQPLDKPSQQLNILTTTTLTIVKERSSARLPDLLAFKGKLKDLPSFLLKLQYKLEGNSDRYPTIRL
jgi:hypothetical protein